MISCVSAKLSRRARVRDIYISTLFKLNLKYAEQLRPDEIYVLSAKHGLLSLTDEISPYNLTLNEMTAPEVKAWATDVLRQLRRVSEIDNTKYIFLAGSRYRKYLLPALKDYVIPLEGLRIGEQLSKLKELTS